jgi:adenine-specific DNA-methyltransferase
LNELCCREVGKDSRLDVFQIDFAEGAGGAKRIKPKSFWEGSEFANEAGSLELKKLFSEKVFETPKPTGLLRYCLEHATQNDDLILDFFAGSATSADAMLAMNAIDGGRRRFIMVQLPEVVDEKSDAFKAGFTTIAEISKERIRRAGAKILEGECHPDWNRDVGFRVLKIDSSNMADVYYTPDATTQADLLLRVDNIKQGRTAEDLLFQVLLDWGVDLTLPVMRETVEGKTVFTVAGTALIACFDNGVDEALVKTLATRKPLRVVFKDTGFKDDATKINVKQIFKSLSPDTEVKAI